VNKQVFTEYQKWYSARDETCRANSNSNECRNMKYYEEFVSLEDRQLHAYSEALEASKAAHALGTMDDLSLYEQVNGVKDTEYNLTTGFIKSHSNADPQMRVIGELRYSVADSLSGITFNSTPAQPTFTNLFNGCNVGSTNLAAAFQSVFGKTGDGSNSPLVELNAAALGLVYSGKGSYTENSTDQDAIYSQVNIGFHQYERHRGAVETFKPKSQNLNVRLTHGVSNSQSDANTLNLTFTAEGGLRNCNLAGDNCTTIYRTGDKHWEIVAEKEEHSDCTNFVCDTTTMIKDTQTLMQAGCADKDDHSATQWFQTTETRV
jgi:hypothetical protein